MKRLGSFLLILALFALPACNGPEAALESSASSAETPRPSLSTPRPAPSQEVPQPMVYEEWLDALPAAEKNWSGLTSVEYLADLDFLHQQLLENYPFFGVAKRKEGVNFVARYRSAREKMASCDNDYDFRNILRMDYLDYIGHLDLWGTRFFAMREDMATAKPDKNERPDKFGPYLEALDNPVTQDYYVKMRDWYDETEENYAAYLAENSSVGAQEDDGEEGEYWEDDAYDYQNVETQIMYQGKVAYVFVDTFDMSFYDQDRETLFAFYQRIGDCDHLIFDITNNIGGGMAYFADLMVAPHIDKTLTVPVYQLVKAGENNRRFLYLDEGVSEGIWKPVDQLPDLPKLNQDDLADLDYFSDEPYSIAPSEERSPFKGKIWLLVSENNYSSAEFAAMFSKQSGFATLVGKRTGGDGIGVDPIYLTLPNTGLVVQYSPIYGITPDGANSEEFGTSPDIFLREDERALDACFRAIDAEMTE